MTKKQAKFISELWNNQFAGSTAPTMTKAVIQEPTMKLHYAKSWGVSIVPEGDENDGYAFYHNEEFADVIRTFKVAGYVHIEDGKVVGRLY